MVSVISCCQFCSDGSDSETRGLTSLCDSGGNSVLECEHENQGPSSQTFSSPNALAGGFRDSSMLESDEFCFTEMTGVSNCETPAYIADRRFPVPEANSSSVAVCGDNLNLPLWKCENDSQIKHIGYDAQSECMKNLYWVIIRQRHWQLVHSLKILL